MTSRVLDPWSNEKYAPVVRGRIAARSMSELEFRFVTVTRAYDDQHLLTKTKSLYLTRLHYHTENGFSFGQAFCY